MYPTSSLQQARIALAERLRELRLDAGITGKELARRCGWSVAKSSRIENARTVPSDADIRAWCSACAAESQAADLVAANRQADQMYMQWRRLQRTGLKRLQEAGVPLYERTRVFRSYSPRAFPGYLQTPGYATALLSTIAGFRGTPDDVSEAVEARIRRSHVVTEGDHRFAVVLEECALRFRAASAAVMTGQLGHLLAVMALPNVVLGVIPDTAAREGVMWPLESFTIFDDQRVSVELLSAAVGIVAPGEIELYDRAFARLTELAVYGDDARALILKAIEALG